LTELLRKERKKEVKADVALAAQIRLMTANGVVRVSGINNVSVSYSPAQTS
jgi:hypothetical protein